MAIRVQLRAIVPRGLILDPGKFDKNLRQAVNESLGLIRNDFNATTRTWEERVAFKMQPASDRGNSIRGFVGTDNMIYVYVDQGTRAHPIVAQRAPYLVFRSGRYQPKTRPGVIGSRSRGSRSGSFRSPKRVWHPGTEARNFAKTIEKRRQRNVETKVRAAFLKSLRSARS